MQGSTDAGCHELATRIVDMWLLVDGAEPNDITTDIAFLRPYIDHARSRYDELKKTHGFMEANRVARIEAIAHLCWRCGFNRGEDE